MATPSESSSGNEKSDQLSQPGKNPTWTLTNADQPGVALVTSPLIGSNYIAWSIAFRTALEAKRKIGFINGTLPKPTDSTEYEIWKPIDSMREMVTTEQGTDTIIKYWNRLHRWWDEWARLSPSPRCHCGKCTCEVNKRLEEKESSSRLMQFLMGLNQSFDALRGQILNLDPMPAVNRAYNMAIQLERQREVNLTYGGSIAGTSTQEGSEMVMAMKGTRNEGYRRRETKEEKYSKYCEHCHMNGHLKEACFKLQGYPEWYKELKKRNPNGKKPPSMAANVADSPLEDPSTEKTEQGNQMAVLSMLMKELTKAMKGGSTESVSFAQLGNFAGNTNNSMKTCQYAWIIDTGASSHICHTKLLMHNVKTLNKPLKMHLPTGHAMNVLEAGSVLLKTGIEIHYVLYIPSFKYNLLSVSKLAKDLNVTVTFDSHHCLIQDLKTRRTLAKGKVDGNLYLLDIRSSKKETSSREHCNSVNSCKTCTWHNRLGHCPLTVLKQIEEIKVNDENFPTACDICHFAKQQRNPFSKSITRSDSIFDLIHVDLWGPYKEKCTLTNATYFLTIVDDHSRVTWVFLIQHKHMVPQLLCNFITMIKNQYGKSIKSVRTDRGTEFTNTQCDSFFKEKGIEHQKTCSYTPQQNGVVERKHKHILQIARALMFQSNLPKGFWGEAIMTSVYIMNRLPSTTLKGKTPYETLMGKRADYDRLRTFGSLCYITNTAPHKDKFESRAYKCVFLGYASGYKAYKVYNMVNHKLHISRDVVFFEEIFPFQEKDKDLESTIPTTVQSSGDSEHLQVYDEQVDNQQNGQNCEETERMRDDASDFHSDIEEDLRQDTEVDNQQIISKHMYSLATGVAEVDEKRANRTTKTRPEQHNS
ncbi:retroelement pol polyprotein-like [Senna tora]|uniref:Retroelement pol polyprotein-like n=1 Tax=Senna tora TaxID=362788 RepID=A0A834TLL9_9FABA|nr:retroelement pol polyprotein-like [Senna tora]